MGKYDVLNFAKALGLMYEGQKEQDFLRQMVVETHHFYHISAAPCGYMPRRDLIATLRLDDQMNRVDYNNALAICMNTLKQYQSWS